MTKTSTLMLLAAATLTLSACGGSAATDPGVGDVSGEDADSGEAPEVESEVVAATPSCETVEAFAARMVDVEIAYDYEPSSSPRELAEGADVVMRGELTGEVVDRSGHIGYEIRVDEILAGEASEASETAVVSVPYNGFLLEAEPFVEAAAPGVPVIVFAYSWPGVPGGLTAAVAEGFLTACDGGARIGWVGEGGEWSEMASLDDVAQAVSAATE